MTKTLDVGQMIPAGTYVLLTSGSYSSFGVIGLFFAETDIVIPAGSSPFAGCPPIADYAKLSVLLKEIEHVEVWTGDN